MQYDGKLLGRARGRLEQIKADNSDEHARRIKKIYREIPQIEVIDGRLRSHTIELVRLTLDRTGDISEKLQALENKNLELQAARAELLVEHGYPFDYLDEIYSCPVCNDTGAVGAEVCDCLRKLYNAELTKELSGLLRRGDECFENFNPSLYSDKYREDFGASPREQMVIIYNICKKYADNFPKVSSNLLMTGNPGLGKTYLSACMARRVAERGYSVCYDSSASAFSAFETQKFSRDPEEAEAAGQTVKRMLSCDLLILDDLGTEFVTPSAISAFYTLLNTRLTAGRHMVINTILSDEAIEAKYSPAIVSRLEGEFTKVRFIGDDIRKNRP